VKRATAACPSRTTVSSASVDRGRSASLATETARG
jgi:hypothetical protein